MARKNAADYPYMDTVLFFDEANTTEAIGVIKEIMCDKSLGGKPIKLHERLKIVAACNPYRKYVDQFSIHFYIIYSQTCLKGHLYLTNHCL
jgi:hypothetical protein